MLSRSSKLFCVVAGCALLNSCGGNNNPTPTPSPTSTSTATPTPTPTASPTATNFDFTESFSLTSPRAYIYAYFTPTGSSTETFSDASRIGTGGGLQYDADTGDVDFGFSDQTALIPFDETQLVSSSATARTYEKGDESLFIKVPNGDVLWASYQRFDSTILNTVTGSLRSNRVVLLANPVLASTALASDVSYVGTPFVVGGTSGSTMDGKVSSPQITLTIDIDANSDNDDFVTGSLPIYVDSGSGPVLVTTITFPIIARTTAGTSTSTFAPGTNTLGGAIATNAEGFSGVYSGTLAGPNREEMVFVFSITHTDKRTFVGHFIGKLT